MPEYGNVDDEFLVYLVLALVLQVTSSGVCVDGIPFHHN